MTPSTCAAPRPCASAAGRRFPSARRRTSDAVGEKTSCASAICEGWIARLPTMPSARARLASFAMAVLVLEVGVGAVDGIEAHRACRRGARGSGHSGRCRRDGPLPRRSPGRRSPASPSSRPCRRSAPRGSRAARGRSRLMFSSASTSSIRTSMPIRRGKLQPLLELPPQQVDEGDVGGEARHRSASPCRCCCPPSRPR